MYKFLQNICAENGSFCKMKKTGCLLTRQPVSEHICSIKGIFNVIDAVRQNFDDVESDGYVFKTVFLQIHHGGAQDMGLFGGIDCFGGSAEAE